MWICADPDLQHWFESMISIIPQSIAADPQADQITFFKFKIYQGDFVP